MSANAHHDAAGLGFLGHLVGRTQLRATQSPLPILERRRPGIFEPRTHAPATTLDLVETAGAANVSDTSSLRRTAAPAAQPAAPTTHSAIPAASLPSMTTAPDRIRPATPAPAAAIATEPRIDAAPIAPRSARSKITRDTSTGRAAASTPSPSAAVVSPTSPSPTIAAPPTMAAASMRGTQIVRVEPSRLESHLKSRTTVIEREVDRRRNASAAAPAPPTMSAASMRGTQIVRVEPSRVESRTTVIERDIDRHRNASAPAPAAPASTLKTPPRLAHSEASKAPVAHPVRSAAMQAMPAPAAPAPVQVSIGRVEIRGFAGAAAPTPARSAASKPQLGLDEYLQQRHGNSR